MERQPHNVAVRLCAALKLTEKNCWSAAQCPIIGNANAHVEKRNLYLTCLVHYFVLHVLLYDYIHH